MKDKIKNGKDDYEIEYSVLSAVFRISILIMILFGIWLFINSFIDDGNVPIEITQDQLEGNIILENKENNISKEEIVSEKDIINKFKDLSAEIVVYNIDDKRYLTFKNFVCDHCEGFQVYISKDDRAEDKIKIGSIIQEERKEYLISKEINLTEYKYIIIEDPTDLTAAYFNLG